MPRTSSAWQGPLYTAYTPLIHPLCTPYTPFTPLIHPVYTPYTPLIHPHTTLIFPLYTPYTPLINPLYTHPPLTRAYIAFHPLFLPRAFA